MRYTNYIFMMQLFNSSTTNMQVYTITQPTFSLLVYGCFRNNLNHR